MCSGFGLRDLRAKDATAEYRAGRPIRELQHLLGGSEQSYAPTDRRGADLRRFPVALLFA